MDISERIQQLEEERRQAEIQAVARMAFLDGQLSILRELRDQKPPEPAPPQE